MKKKKWLLLLIPAVLLLAAALMISLRLLLSAFRPDWLEAMGPAFSTICRFRPT